ncbi:hypothetical protein [Shouchella miscanthi]|uniref:Uncharacterized protein n=1 Tax=Shouchella miscanthi TaxID=2598861 RepID=A0ABU6NM04_9BACI|nr:hypothetical protein [Shouchella miscanthi]
MSRLVRLTLINTISSGIIAFLITTFFASGTIGENLDGVTWVAPEFFLILIGWILGILLACFEKTWTFGIIVMYVSPFVLTPLIIFLISN